jgi:hypothetical protein
LELAGTTLHPGSANATKRIKGRTIESAGCKDEHVVKVLVTVEVEMEEMSMPMIRAQRRIACSSEQRSGRIGIRTELLVHDAGKRGVQQTPLSEGAVPMRKC